MDAGFHPFEDNYYKKKLLDDSGPNADGEEDADWVRRDARQIRIVTRWGIKFVLDDRGSDTTQAEVNELPRANGWMLKTRRSWEEESGTSRGFAIESNDKNELNTTRWYTPKSKVVEMNDRKDYTIICTDTRDEISREWMGLRENEFALRVSMTEDPEKDTYHLKLDKANGYLRLKTAAGGDNGRRPQPEAFNSAVVGLNQGMECRDGRYCVDGVWAEVVDQENRGLWFSGKEKMGIWRSRQGKDQFIMISDGKNSIVVRNNVEGPMQLYCLQDVEVIAGRNIVMKADRRISLKAGQDIVLEAANSGHARLTGQAFFLDVPQQRGSTAGLNPTQLNQDKREPDDRGAVGNGPFDEVVDTVIGCKGDER
jgi:hypothetical protein